MVMLLGECRKNYRSKYVLWMLS